MMGLTDAAAIKRRQPKVVVDCGNGAAALVAPQLFKALGCRITTLNAQPDGFFPGRASEPTRENVSDLLAAVTACGAEMGIAFDGDADRVIFVDERGEYVIGDRSFALATGIALRRRRGAVVTTVATTNAIADVAKKYGCGVEYTRVGGPYISKRMREVNAVIGGEEAGGIVWPELHPGKDGIMSAVRIVEHCCRTGKRLSELLADVPVYYNSKTKIECSEAEKVRIVAGIGGFARGGKMTRTDGVRIDFDDAWVIVRASGTEGYVRVFAEAKAQKRADALAREYARFVGEIKRAKH
jgi:phosphomannomutase/phosphoglucomutase